jgi:predicted O-linked N-acetylglucosamine transferase (SPINDLY family)
MSVDALAIARQHYQAGNLPQAEQAFRQILKTAPNPLAVCAGNDLGLVLLAQGRLDEAVATFQHALRVDPNYFPAQHNLGWALHQKGQYLEAVACCRQALRLKPDSAEAHNHLGLALVKQGKIDEAIASYHRALELRPDTPEIHNNLGLALDAQGKEEEALACYQEAVRLNPKFAAAYSNSGIAHQKRCQLDEALACFRQALQIKPDNAHAHSNLLGVFPYHPDYDARAMFEEYSHWNQAHAEPLKKHIQPHTNQPNPDRKLRIGYVSPDFREHVDSFFTIPLLSNHDHRHFEIFCYADVLCPDAVTERLRGYADCWRSTAGLSDQQVADLVRGDQIDILVDLELHLAGNRLLVFARKPAPVQVAWLGCPGTTGLSTMDYRLTDPYLDPPGLFDAFYSEESVRLPDTFWCYDPLTDRPAVNALPAVNNGYITFGCLNNFCKVNDGCLALWARVLRAVPQSRLLLLAPRGWARDHVGARFHQEGIAAERVEFVHNQPRKDYLKLYHRIDVCLDPGPYNGHTTSLDAMWMGVPIITLVGKTVFGRGGWSQLSNLGLQKLAAESPEQYVALAAQLAGDLCRLQELRGSLRQRMQRSALMDGNRFARHMEEAYRQMWRKWCQQHGSEGVSVERLALARRHHQSGNLQAAEELYRQLLEAEPGNARVWYLRGAACQALGELAEAVASLQQAIQLRPEFADAHNHLGVTYAQEKRWQEAVASFRQALRYQPERAETHHNLALALLKQEKLEDAVVHFREAVRIEPNFVQARHNLCQALRRQGKLAEEIAVLEEPLRREGGGG